MPSMKTTKTILPLALACLLPSIGTQAQTLFSDNFDLETPSSTSPFYTIATSPNTRITFGYDYGTAYSGNLGMGIAPNTVGGTTKGLKMEANINSAATAIGSLAISPSQTFAGNYSIKFDLWLNSIGPFPGGGTGSTEHFSAGVGYNGVTLQNSASGSGVWFGADSEGGFAATTSSYPDYFARVGTTLQGTNSSIYAAESVDAGNSRDNRDAYYAGLFPGTTPPSSQTSIVAAQTGTTENGTLAFNWHEVEITRNGNTVTWTIDDHPIATVTDPAATATDRIYVGYIDPTSSLGNTNVSFGIIDNLRVEAVPEPGTIALGLLGAAGLFLVRRKK